MNIPTHAGKAKLGRGARVFGLLCLAWVAAMPAQTGQLRAGAARVEITPGAGEAFPLSGYGARVNLNTGVHDSLFVRALVVDDGERQGLVVSCDILFVTDAIWRNASVRIEKEVGIPAEAALLAATHTHGAPSSSPVKEEFAERSAMWTRRVEDAIVEAARMAKASLAPARFGVAKGKAFVNINRRSRMADGSWGLGQNPEGVSDKTLSVVRFESMNGEPIALLLNYPVHGVVMGPKNYQITSDLPGVTEQLVERHFGEKTVALWTSGASGDQNPIYATQDDFGRLGALALILSEEAIRVANGVPVSANVRIRFAQREVSCPAKARDTAPQRPGIPRRFSEDDPVPIRLSLLMIGRVALAGVSGEVLTPIGERLKAESPYTNTLMVTHTNGSIGYIADDDAYGQVSYEIRSTPVKPGCAESAIVNTFLEMIDQF